MDELKICETFTGPFSRGSSHRPPFPCFLLALALRVTVHCVGSSSVRWEELEAQSTLSSIHPPRNRLTSNAFTQTLETKAQDGFLLSGMLLLPCSSHVKARLFALGSFP